MLKLAASCLLFAFAAIGADQPVLKSAADMEHISLADASAGRRFELTGTISGFLSTSATLPAQLLFRDQSGVTILSNHLKLQDEKFLPNDLVRAAGEIATRGRGIYAKLDRLTLIRHQAPDPARAASVTELISGELDGRLVTTRGTVVAVFPDEIDSSWIYLILTDGQASIYAPLLHQNFGIDNPDALTGADVELTGWCCNSALSGLRLHLGPCFTTADNGLRIRRQRRHDPFDVPALADCRQLSPAEITGLGPRKLVGTVIAAWHQDRFLLKTDDGRLSGVELVNPGTPRFGMKVEAVGSPETDLYHLNLSSARWRAIPRSPVAAPLAPMDIEPQDILTEINGRQRYNASLHGRPLRIRGTVRILPQPEDPNGQLYVECQGVLVPADFQTLPSTLTDLKSGSTVQVAGTCVFESDNWRPNAIFPSIRRFVIVGRTADDLQLIANPPWWTPLRLLVVIGALIAGLAGFGLWNRMLRRRVEQRSQSLLEEQIAHVSSNLKTMERTRLAIELHDSIAQSLTGVALEIQTAKATIRDDIALADTHLDIADRSLKSCREELRNCLRDLRSDALEVNDLNEAIRMTLATQTDGAEISIRFNVPRERLTDNTLHALLRIIRELVLNAVRHGHARAIKVAGALEANRLLFSVTDNGCGFDPNRRPGIAEGHFGLQGVAERVNGFAGQLDITSAPGAGTKVTIAMRLPAEEPSCPR